MEAASFSSGAAICVSTLEETSLAFSSNAQTLVASCTMFEEDDNAGKPQHAQVAKLDLCCLAVYLCVMKSVV